MDWASPTHLCDGRPPERAGNRERSESESCHDEARGGVQEHGDSPQRRIGETVQSGQVVSDRPQERCPGLWAWSGGSGIEKHSCGSASKQKGLGVQGRQSAPRPHGEASLNVAGRPDSVKEENSKSSASTVDVRSIHVRGAKSSKHRNIVEFSVSQHLQQTHPNAAERIRRISWDSVRTSSYVKKHFQYQ